MPVPFIGLARGGAKGPCPQKIFGKHSDFVL